MGTYSNVYIVYKGNVHPRKQIISCVSSSKSKLARGYLIQTKLIVLFMLAGDLEARPRAEGRAGEWVCCWWFSCQGERPFGGKGGAMVDLTQTTLWQPATFYRAHVTVSSHKQSLCMHYRCHVLALFCYWLKRCQVVYMDIDWVITQMKDVVLCVSAGQFSENSALRMYHCRLEILNE